MSAATTQAVQVGSIPMVGGGSSTPVAQIFQGYDTFVGSARSTAVTGEFVTLGTQAEATCHVYRGSESLCQALGVSASAQASFGFGSVDAKAEFVKSLNLTTTSVCILVHASVKHTQSMTSVALKKGVSTTDPKRFFQGYGDSFVSSVSTGAEYIAVYSFYTQSLTEQANLAATIKGTIPSAGNLSASVQGDIAKAKSKATVQMDMHHIITGIDGLTYPHEDKIVDFALDFASKAQKANSIIGYGTTGYEHVPEMPDFGHVPASRALIQHDDGSPGTVTLQLSALRGVANQIAWLNDSEAGIYQAYGYSGDNLLQQRAQQNSADIAALQAFVFSLAADPAQDSKPPEVPSLVYGTPALAFTRGAGPSYGVPGGDSFQDFTPDQIVHRVKLSSLQLVTDSGLVGLVAGYALPDGNQLITRGESNGTKGPTLTLQPGEFVTQISGACSDKAITQIKFVTNQGHWLWYPAAPAAQVPETFHWQASPGHVLVGFQVRCGKTLNSFQPVTLALNPATWGPLPAHLLQ